MKYEDYPVDSELLYLLGDNGMGTRMTESEKHMGVGMCVREREREKASLIE